MPSKVFSCCDFNKFDGKCYEKLGMNCIGYTGPSEWLIINDKMILKNSKIYSEYKDKSRGIIWDSGNKKYEIIFNN